MFLRKSHARDPLPMTMAGVRMGERVLQIGIDDDRLVGAIAARVGLSGHAAMAVAGEADAARARHGAVEASTVLDVHVTPLDVLPFTSGAFDVVVVHSVGGLVASLADGVRAGLFRECHRVLRQGGRLIAIEAGARTGLASLLRSGVKSEPGAENAGASAMLGAAGFKPVRLLADREGFRFTEGLKG